jgi:hypothetical protein
VVGRLNQSQADEIALCRVEQFDFQRVLSSLIEAANHLGCRVDPDPSVSDCLGDGGKSRWQLLTVQGRTRPNRSTKTHSPRRLGLRHPRELLKEVDGATVPMPVGEPRGP